MKAQMCSSMAICGTEPELKDAKPELPDKIL